MRRLKILTWLTHGSYMYYLSQVPHDFFLMMQPGRPPGYGGRCGSLRWGDNVFDQPLESVKEQAFDCIIYQDDHQFLDDRQRWLSDAQRRLPQLYIEHDPPRAHPTDSRHPVDDPSVLLVHVTPFNALMWDNGRSPTVVIEHGVTDPGVRWRGDLARGITVINELDKRGRRLGADVFMQARTQLPLDLAGMGNAALDGLGEWPLHALPALCARYRLFFHPARYTSLGLGLVEAMMLGMPVVALATTEVATVIENGVSGYIDTCPDRLIGRMRELLRHHRIAAHIGAGARECALARFGMTRFIRDWNAALQLATS